MYNKSVQRKIMWFAHKMALIGLQYGQRSYKIGLQGIHPNVVQFALKILYADVTRTLTLVKILTYLAIFYL